jgi:drug/metabolite transporter (DMT)-like permease
VAWFHGLSLLGADRGGVFAAVVPVCATAAAALSQAALPSAAQMTGIALVSVGLIYALRAPRRAPQPYPTVSRPGIAVLPRLALSAAA